MIATCIDWGKPVHFKVKVEKGKRYDLTKQVGGSLIELGKSMVLQGNKKEYPENWGKGQRLIASGNSMLLCGDHAFVVKREKNGKLERELRVHECRQRGCPPCSNKMNQDQVKAINEMVDCFGEERFQFLVVTIPSVKIQGCRKDFNSLNKSICDLSRLPIWKAYSPGFAKSVEGNVKDNNSVNPHSNLLVLTNGKDLRTNRSVKRYINNSPYFKSSMQAYLKNKPGMTEKRYLKKVQDHLKIGHFYQPFLSGILQSVGLGATCLIQDVYKNPGYEFAKYLTKGFGVDSVFVAHFLSEMKGFRLFSYFGELKKFKSSFRKEERDKELFERISDSLDPVEKPKGVLLIPNNSNQVIPPDCKEVLRYIKGDQEGNTKQYVKRVYLDGSVKWFRVCKWEYDCTAYELIVRAMFYEYPSDLLLFQKLQESKRFDVEILNFHSNN